MSDVRLQALERWLSEVVKPGLTKVVPASGDASFRRYFRVICKNVTYIAMDAPPDREDVTTFMRVADLFGAQGLNVPRIIAHDVPQGFLLLTDLGERQYLPCLNADTADQLYGDAFSALLKLQAGEPRNAGVLPLYDRQRLQAEMDLFRDWYIMRHFSVDLDPEQEDVLRVACNLLIASALEQPQVWVHRDYHSRNLMLTETDNPGVLDFQDAVIGPVTYDLVSLLRDSYIDWPNDQVESWALDYLHRAIAAGICPRTDDKTLLRWFDWMGIQRQLKVVGIFTRLNLRDGKPGYLRDIPRTLNYLLHALRRYAELRPLYTLIIKLTGDAPRAT